MGYQLAKLRVDHPLLSATPAAGRDFQRLVDRLLFVNAVRFRRLWAYYGNPMRVTAALAEESAPGSQRPYLQAQEWGLPPRLTGTWSGDEPFTGEPAADIARKELVIENDIGWRIDAMVDTLFGRPIVVESDASDEPRRQVISDLLRRVLAQAGGQAFLQRLALVGAVCGSVDVLVKLDAQRAGVAQKAAALHAAGSATSDETTATSDETHLKSDETHIKRDETQPTGDQTPVPAGRPASPELLDALASCIRLEIVEPARALPILDPLDASRLIAYAQVYQAPRSPLAPVDVDPPGQRRSGWLRRLLGEIADVPPEPPMLTVVELHAPDRWQVYHDGKLVAAGESPLGTLPVVHVQNVARPLAWEGGGDVEPLIPLQDELNTRLSDRATRLALHSARMYLGIGIEEFVDQPIQPGRMWSTDNPEARVIEFGGDAAAPSEEAAIREVREAIDKQSGVNPVAAGAIRNRVGSLTSAAALRLTFQAMLTRTARKRVNYGAAIERICALTLHWLDAAGLFATTAGERGVRISWPDPLETWVDPAATSESQIPVARHGP